MVFLMGASALPFFNQNSYANELRQASIDADGVNRCILSMLASERAYGRSLQKIVLNELRLELWDLRNNIIYFSLPQSVPPTNRVFNAVSKKPEFRREGKFIGGNIEIDGMHITRTKEKFYLFAINYENISFDPDRIITLDFGRERYSVSLGKLALFLRNDSIYGGRLRVNKVPYGMEKPDFLNHGALVTPKGEITLAGFVQQIIDGKVSTEEKIQALLDFVTEKIRYDQDELDLGGGFLQRFAETLIAREGDRSNKLILFASMLEQISVEYLLVYSENNIFAAVNQKYFSKNSPYAFDFKNKKWLPAETTINGFKIGETRLDKPELLQEIKYVQEPSQKNVLLTFPDEKLILFTA